MSYIIELMIAIIRLAISGLLTVSLMSFGACKSEQGPTASKVNSADGVSIAFTVQGKGNPALVFVHGWSCDKTYWDAQVAHFASEHRVVAIDIAGHGDSGLNRNDWTMPAFGEDVATVINKLDLERVILIGHSMGGSVIIEAARLVPDRVLALVGADTFTIVERAATPEQVAQMVAGLNADFAGMVSNMVKGSMFIPESDPALVDRIYSDMSAAPPAVALGMIEALGAYDAGSSLEDVRAPVYCINSESRQLDVEAVRRHASSFTPRYMAGVGHFVMIEDPDMFNRLLAEIIDEVAKSNKK